MAMPYENHHQIIIETYSARKSGSKFEIRVRPVDGQMFPQDIMVQFSRKARDAHPVGTRFRIWVKESDIQGGTPFLQSPWQWPYQVVE